MRPLPGTICDQCGTEGLEVLAGRARLRYWFVNGGGLRGQVEACRNCGTSGTRGGRYLTSSGRHIWSLPVRLLSAVRDERRWYPPPLFYTYVGAAAGVLATVPAVLVRRSLLWRWPPAAALGAMLGVFVLSVASAFRGGGVRRAILEVVSPQRARAERSDAVARLLRERAAHRAVLVPAVWSGPVALVGHGVNDPDGPGRRLVSLSILAGSGADPGSTPRLMIEHEYDHPPVSLLQERAVTSLVSEETTVDQPDLRGLDPRRPGDRARIDEVVAAAERRQAARERELGQHWRAGAVRVDGETVTASLLAGDGAAAAVFEHEGVAVTVTCVGLDLADLHLATTQDLDTLIDGMRRRDEQMFG